jgi:hypothetical protein
MKRILNILLVTLFAVALMQLFRTHMELKYNHDALAMEMKHKIAQFDAVVAMNVQQTHLDAKKNAELEAQIAALTVEANQLISSQ